MNAASVLRVGMISWLRKSGLEAGFPFCIRTMRLRMFGVCVFCLVCGMGFSCATDSGPRSPGATGPGVPGSPGPRGPRGPIPARPADVILNTSGRSLDQPTLGSYGFSYEIRTSIQDAYFRNLFYALCVEILQKIALRFFMRRDSSCEHVGTRAELML